MPANEPVIKIATYEVKGSIARGIYNNTAIRVPAVPGAKGDKPLPKPKLKKWIG